jgi:hypothetical protein
MNSDDWRTSLIDDIGKLVAQWHSGDLEVSHPSDDLHDDSNWTSENTDSLVFCVETLLAIFERENCRLLTGSAECGSHGGAPPALST